MPEVHDVSVGLIDQPKETGTAHEYPATLHSHAW
jgi:hypothetical protein